MFLESPRIHQTIRSLSEGNKKTQYLMQKISIM